jgi:hypothetical protein
MRADEATGAVVLAAQTRFYLGQMLAATGDIGRGRVLLAALRDQFADWGIPVWQGKAAQALAALDVNAEI